MCYVWKTKENNQTSIIPTSIIQIFLIIQSSFSGHICFMNNITRTHTHMHTICNTFFYIKQSKCKETSVEIKFVPLSNCWLLLIRHVHYFVNHTAQFRAWKGAKSCIIFCIFSSPFFLDYQISMFLVIINFFIKYKTFKLSEWLASNFSWQYRH